MYRGVTDQRITFGYVFRHITTYLTYLLGEKFMFAILGIAKVDLRRFIFRFVSKLFTCILFLVFHTIKYTSAFNATSEAIISHDSFYFIFCREQELNMAVIKSAI